MTRPITLLIDQQTASQRPSRKEALARQRIEEDPSLDVVQAPLGPAADHIITGF